jgi:PIN domain nuclease of toxin-antitoxin system
MRILLDTHVLIWLVGQPTRLDAMTRRHLEDEDNEILFSAASIWEIAIKVSLGRNDFIFRPEQVMSQARVIGLIEAPVTAALASQVASLPMHHRDPFDRLIVAQAIAEPAHLYTADPQLPAYSELVHLIA